MMNFEFPSVFALDERWKGNVIRQLVQPGYSSDIAVKSYANKRLKGYVMTSHNGQDGAVLAVVGARSAPAEFDRVLRVGKGCLGSAKVISADSSKAKWVRHPGLTPAPGDLKRYKQRIEEVLDSWQNGFFYLEEDTAPQFKGLRKPQAAAVHAVHAHWGVSDEAATVVMPTGTGKTETMLSIFVSKQCPKLLVIVPTDALRTQIAEKFLTLGVLKQFGVAARGCLYPLVGILKHRLKTVADVDYFFERCHVVVSTIQVAGQCKPEVQARMAEHCPYLFIDEAHHIAAQTWHDFKARFVSRRVLQFTATPFREDDKPVDGKMIFRYPLAKAQAEGYFKPVRFKPVREFDPDKADRAIAERAVAQLLKDRKRFKHILMARVDNIRRAEEVFHLYQKHYPYLDPVQIHTGVASEERRKNKQKMISGTSKAVVCVDMLGEGFDLPELKVAAFHDIRKGLAVTLQLAGRFTRARSDLGDATFVANIADVNVRQELAKLYAQDADWNSLLSQSNDALPEKQMKLQEFVERFSKFPKDIPLQNFCPQMSTAIYKTTCEEWTPEKFKDGIPGADSLERIDHDVDGNTLIILTAAKVPVEWAKIKDVYNWDWGLHVLFWDKAQKLLFMHSSKSNSYYRDLAEAVAGDPVRRAEILKERKQKLAAAPRKIYTVELIKGPAVFRCFHGINRIQFHNVGLSEHLGRRTRYTMRAGSNVGPDISDSQKAQTTKSVIFGTGYENGDRTAIGCSSRGRIWANQTDNLEALGRWCRFIGRKVTDESIDPDKVLEGTLNETLISARPARMPISIDWPLTVYQEPETTFTILTEKGSQLRLHQADIKLKNPSVGGELKFEVCSGKTSLVFALRLSKESPYYSFVPLGHNALIRRGGKEWSEGRPLADFFYENPPIIWFADGSSLEGNVFVELKKAPPPFAKSKIKAWDWKGINLKQEAQITRATRKDPKSIQYQVIKRLKAKKYDVIFDDDGAGESADVVAIRKGRDKIKVEFYHCKYSSAKTPGARVDDLYEVCGQAQKSINWLEEPTNLFVHLLSREPKRKYNWRVSRYERGNEASLFEVKEMSKTYPVELEVFIVQPGLSKAQADKPQMLQLLGVTENYIKDTRRLPFGVIASR